MEKILILDDSKTMLRIIENVVKQIGFSAEHIIKCENGQEGVQAYKENIGNIKAILTDWNMPVMNGLDFIKEIRKTEKSVPIMMITTEGGKESVVTALRAGCNGYVVKPFDAKTLKTKLDPFFNQS